MPQGLTVRTSAPGLGSPQPHRHRGWGHRVHRTGRNETSAPPGCAAPIALPCNVSGLGRVCLAPCLGCTVSGLQRVWVATVSGLRRPVRSGPEATALRRRYQRENERLVTELREGTDKLKAQARGAGPAGPPPGAWSATATVAPCSVGPDRASRSPQEKTAYLEHQRMNMQANLLYSH